MITVLSIIQAINNQLAVNESEGTPSLAVLSAINEGLRWISKQALWSCLHILENSQSINAGEFNLNVPLDYRELDYIVLNDGTYDSKSLKELDGGFGQWLKNRQQNYSGIPIHKVQRGKKWYLEPKADKTYTAKIYYWRYHPTIVALGGTILFGDIFTDAVKQACIGAYLDGKSRHSEAQYYFGKAALLLGPIEETEADFIVERHFTKCQDI